jgi:hypothetical protein
MGDPGIVPPTLDDKYWFNYSKELVDKAIASRNEQAARFVTLVGWLWTIYTASAAVGLTLGKENLTLGPKLFIALPSFILIIAYWLAVRAQTPPNIEFDPQSPQQIRTAYANGVRQKKNLLGWAHFSSLVGGIAVGVALITASVCKPAEKPMARSEFNAEKKGALLTAWGRGIDCKDTIAIRLLSKDSGSAKPLTKIVLCAANGEFGTQFDLEPGSQWKGALVEIKWTDPKDKNVSYAMTREIQ